MDFFIDGIPHTIEYFDQHASAQQILLLQNSEISSLPEISGLQSLFAVAPPLTSKKETFSHFESHPNLDILFLSIPTIHQKSSTIVYLTIYCTKNTIIFIYTPFWGMEKLIQTLKNSQHKDYHSATVLSLFFNILTESDTSFLQKEEEQIAKLEEALVQDPEKKNYIENIISLRKKLLVWKHYYESLYATLSDLEENDNSLFTQNQIKHLHLLTNRADRLRQAVTSLQEALTQAREAYQSQMDIKLNQTTKFFAVLSAFFMPLTLITGWYGMNLVMPEHNLPFVYPLVIILCITIIIINLIAFKKRKWF